MPSPTPMTPRWYQHSQWSRRKAAFTSISASIVMSANGRTASRPGKAANVTIIRRESGSRSQIMPSDSSPACCQ